MSNLNPLRKYLPAQLLQGCHKTTFQKGPFQKGSCVKTNKLKPLCPPPPPRVPSLSRVRAQRGGTKISGFLPLLLPGRFRTSPPAQGRAAASWEKTFPCSLCEQRASEAVSVVQSPEQTLERGKKIKTKRLRWTELCGVRVRSDANSSGHWHRHGQTPSPQRTPKRSNRAENKHEIFYFCCSQKQQNKLFHHPYSVTDT